MEGRADAKGARHDRDVRRAGVAADLGDVAGPAPGLDRRGTCVAAVMPIADARDAIEWELDRTRGRQDRGDAEIGGGEIFAPEEGVLRKRGFEQGAGAFEERVLVTAERSHRIAKQRIALHPGLEMPLRPP